MSEQTTRIPEWDLADRLRKTLRTAKLGTSDMAEYLEVSRNTIGNWIHGHTKPPASAVRLWAERVDVPYEWLAHGIAAGQSPPPRSSHRSRHLELQPEPEITTQPVGACLARHHPRLRGHIRARTPRRHRRTLRSTP